MKDKLLFTPGPLTTSASVKEAMLRDLGSRDFEFIAVVAEIRRKLLEIGGVAGRGYEAILMQGSGTFAIESALGSTIAPRGKLLVAANGAYGRRIAQIASVLKIDRAIVDCPEHRPLDPEAIAAAIRQDTAITCVAAVHCETSTGIFNPIGAIGAVVDGSNRSYLVDAMSSFGAVPLNVEECKIDYLVSSANKCIEGVPGFAFAIARRAALLETEGFARSVSLDLLAQWRGLEANGQFRFTPPTHAILAFRRALQELEQEGGVAARAARYQANYRTLVAGMRAMGFVEYLTPEDQGWIITSFRYPSDPKFDFAKLYAFLNERGFVIYPGIVSEAQCFRIGSIGRIFPDSIRALLAAIRDAMTAMEIALPMARAN
jgi:2-aminoethylphosphonate-pyruvate transaminase